MPTREQREEWQQYVKNLPLEEQLRLRDEQPELYEEPILYKEEGPKKLYVYTIACPDMPWWPMNKDVGDQIDDMQEIAVSVKYKTMQRNCEGLSYWLLWKGVVTDRQGMVRALDESDCVAFKRSVYDGMPCYFVDWSGIEFIWIKEESLENRGIEPRIPPWEIEKLAEMGLEPIDPRTEHLPDLPGISLSKIFWSR